MEGNREMCGGKQGEVGRCGEANGRKGEPWTLQLSRPSGLTRKLYCICVVLSLTMIMTRNWAGSRKYPLSEQSLWLNCSVPSRFIWFMEAEVGRGRLAISVIKWGREGLEGA